MEKKKKQNQKISLQGFKDFLKGVKLISIEIIELNFNKKENFKPPAKLELAEKIEYRKYNNKNQFTVFTTFRLTGIKKEDSEDKKEGMIIVIKFKSSYSCKNRIDIKYFNKFNYYSLNDCWPYFRQCVHDISIKANLPPLVVDLQRIYSP